jgi:hypothetical protein
MEETLTQFNAREKRKWQIALRRYVLEKQLCSAYAPYFGLDIEMFRQWISLQFTQDLNWNNFAKAWQFDHIVPVAYFDLKNKEDLRLCWNFTNIRVEPTDVNSFRGNRIDIIGVRNYFKDLYKRTNYTYCLKMLSKIDIIALSTIESNTKLEEFIITNKPYFLDIAKLTEEELIRLNRGTPFDNLMAEREIAKKFG